MSELKYKIFIQSVKQKIDVKKEKIRLIELWDKNKRSKNHVISFPEGKGWDIKVVQKCLEPSQTWENSKQRIHKTEKRKQKNPQTQKDKPKEIKPKSEN